MEKLNIYAINFSPCEPDETVSVRKSEIVDTVFRNYNEKKGFKYELGEVKMLSFCPKDSKEHTSFVDGYVFRVTKSPCILIFNTFSDVNIIPKTAYSRLYHYLHSKRILEIYFSDYSLKHTIREYNIVLKNFYNIEFKKQDKRFKHSPYTDDITQKLIALRSQTPPVRYADLSDVTGIPISTISSWEVPAKGKGRAITPKEADELRSLINKMVNDIENQSDEENSVKIYYQKYIKAEGQG